MTHRTLALDLSQAEGRSELAPLNPALATSIDLKSHVRRQELDIPGRRGYQGGSERGFAADSGGHNTRATNFHPLKLPPCKLIVSLQGFWVHHQLGRPGQGPRSYGSRGIAWHQWRTGQQGVRADPVRKSLPTWVSKLLPSLPSLNAHRSKPNVLSRSSWTIRPVTGMWIPARAARRRTAPPMASSSSGRPAA